MKILIADTQTLFRDGLKLALQAADIHPTYIREHVTFEDMSADPEYVSSDLIILASNCLNQQARHKLYRLRLLNTDNSIIISVDDPEDLSLYNRQGLDGVISKTAPLNSHVSLIKTLMQETHRSQPPLPPHLSRLHERAAAAGLTARQTEIWQLIAQGLRNEQIAAKLQISTGTVRIHTSAIYRKLKVSSRTKAMLLTF